MVENRRHDPLLDEEDSGGFSYIFDIQADAFGYDSGYMDSSVPVYIVSGEASYGDKREPRRKFYSLGDGWNIVDNGNGVVHASGKPDKAFRSTTNIRRLINRIAKPAEEGGLGMADFLRARGGDPRRAGLLAGTRWRFQQEEIENWDGSKRNIDLPVEYLGEIGASAGSSGASVTAMTGTGAATSTGGGDAAARVAAAMANGGTVNPQVRLDALNVAKNYADPKEFLNAALQEVPALGSPENSALLDQVISGALWQEAHQG